MSGSEPAKEANHELAQPHFLHQATAGRRRLQTGVRGVHPPGSDVPALVHWRFERVPAIPMIEI